MKKLFISFVVLFSSNVFAQEITFYLPDEISANVFQEDIAIASGKEGAVGDVFCLGFPGGQATAQGIILIDPAGSIPTRGIVPSFVSTGSPIRPGSRIKQLSAGIPCQVYTADGNAKSMYRFTGIIE